MSLIHYAARLETENARLTCALDKAAARFEYCANMIAEGHNILGTRRAEQIIKAKHFALEARAALSPVLIEDGE